MNFLTTSLKKKVTVVFSKEGRNRDLFLQFWLRAVGGAKVSKMRSLESENHVYKEQTLGRTWPALQSN